MTVAEAEQVEAEEAAAGATPVVPRDLAAIAIQVAGHRLPLTKGRRPVPPTIQTTEMTTRVLTMMTKALARDQRTSHSNVGSLMR